MLMVKEMRPGIVFHAVQKSACAFFANALGPTLYLPIRMISAWAEQDLSSFAPGAIVVFREFLLCRTNLAVLMHCTKFTPVLARQPLPPALEEKGAL